MKKMRSTNLTHKQLEKFYSEFDTDGDGYLNKEEFVGMLKKLIGIYECEDTCMMLWAMFDENQDGVLGASEFEAMCRHIDLSTSEQHELVRSHARV